MRPRLSFPAMARPRGGSFRTTALIVGSALFMEQLDASVLATALPAMGRSFHVQALAMSVALTSYLLSLAVFIPASGRFADRFGARTVFRAAIGLFTLGSILCGQADSLGFLVAARILQGIGGAMMVPVGRLVLLRTTEKSQLVGAMSWLLVPALVGPIAGPPVGGLFVTYLSWRWIFYINVPIGALGMLLASLYIPDVREDGPVRFDLTGLALSGASLACLTFGLEMGSRGVTSPLATAGIIVLGVAAGASYLRHARRHPEPILDVTLMRLPTFRLSVLGGALTRITTGAMPFLLPMMLQLDFGLSAAASGLTTFVTAIGAMLMKFTAQPLLRRFGFRNTLVWNGVLSTGTLALCAAFRPSWSIGGIDAVLLLGGFFQSMQFTAYNTIAYDEVPRARMSAATSFYATFQQLMLSLGIAISAAVLSASRQLTGHAVPGLVDFSAAFLSVALISFLSSPVCAKLPRDAGEQMSGHRTTAR